MDSWRKRRTLYMVIRDVGDEDIMMMGYMFSAQNLSGTNVVERVSEHALCLRAWALASAGMEVSRGREPTL